MKAKFIAVAFVASILQGAFMAMPASAAITSVPLGHNGPVGGNQTIAPYGPATKWCMLTGNQASIPAQNSQISLSHAQYSRLDWGSGCTTPLAANGMYMGSSVYFYNGTYWDRVPNCYDKYSSSTNSDTSSGSWAPANCKSFNATTSYSIRSESFVDLPANDQRVYIASWFVTV